MTSIPATDAVTGVQALTARLSSTDLFALVAAALNTLDARGEDVAPDGGRIVGESARVVWDTDTETYRLETRAAAGGDGPGTLTVLADDGTAVEIVPVEVCGGDR